MDICLDYRKVEKARTRARCAIQQFFHRRFPGHVALLFCEVDEKLARDVDAAIIPDNSWTRNVAQNRLVYVIHFHGVIFTPSVRVVDLADVFRFTPNGKLSKLFSGSRQVHVEWLDRVDDGGRVVLDVRGVSGYSTKNHYRPAVDTHQLEGFPEWLFIHNQIVNDPKSVLISGLREVELHLGIRTTLHHIRKVMRRQWNRMTLDERWEENVPDDSEFDDTFEYSALEDGSPGSALSASSEEVDILNSDSPTIWNRLAKQVGRKLAAFVGIMSRNTVPTVENLIRWARIVWARGDPR
jgi:hypothetical protein